MSLINKIIAALLVVISIAFIVMLFFYMRNKTELEKTCRLLSQAELNIKALEQSNANLVKYNSEKDNELKKIKADHKKALANKPTDSCGDAKPSKELLKFYKGNIQ